MEWSADTTILGTLIVGVAVLNWRMYARLDVKIDGLRDSWRTEIDGLRKEIADVRKEIGGLRDSLRGEIDGLRREIAAVRSDLGNLGRELSELRGEIRGRFGTPTLDPAAE